MAIVFQSTGVKAHLTVVWIALTPIEQAFASQTPVVSTTSNSRKNNSK